MNNLPKKKILEIDITDARTDVILEYVSSSIQKRVEKYFIVTPNPEMMVYAGKHKEFMRTLNNAQIALCDGAGLQIASLILGKPISQRITGTDFVKIFCENNQKNNVSIGFLGARGNVAELAAERLLHQYPNLNVVFAASEWGQEGWSFNSKFKVQHSKLNRQGEKTSSQKPAASSTRHIDMLFVAYGFPKQEEWMAEHIDTLDVSVMMGVGGAFDYISGKVSRAPFLIRFIGFEWLYRLIRQPWRIRRQQALLEFIWLVIKARMSH